MATSSGGMRGQTKAAASGGKRATSTEAASLRHHFREFTESGKKHHWGKQAKERRMTAVLVYVNTSKQVGDREHIADQDAAEARFKENDSEGVAFEYEVLVRQVLGSF